mgnify:CR=1 FL=1
MNHKDVDDYYLQKMLVNDDLIEKPSKISNVDEPGVQINNKPWKILTTKDAKEIYTLTSAEKG